MTDKCAICGTTENVTRDVYKGQPRGFLCAEHKEAVDFLSDNPGWAEKAIAYLEKKND